MSVKTIVGLVCLYWSVSIHGSLGGGGGACRQRSFLFNFGDSNSDTGGASVLRGKPLELPEGRAFFHEPTGRICDGRLLLDFLCESVGTKYLSPYLDAHAFAPDFSNGVNFALSTSDTLRRRSLHSELSDCAVRPLPQCLPSPPLHLGSRLDSLLISFFISN